MILLAPQSYADAAALDVDAFIAYEDVGAHLAATAADDRVAFESRLFDLAIEKAGKGYNPETDQAVSPAADEVPVPPGSPGTSSPPSDFRT